MVLLFFTIKTDSGCATIANKKVVEPRAGHIWEQVRREQWLPGVLATRLHAFYWKGTDMGLPLA